MGMYTEIYINVDLKEDTPDEVINVLKAMCNFDYQSEHLARFHKRWSYLFSNGSYCTPHTSTANLTYDSISKQWSLLGKGDIKNYNSEIEEFFEWIQPHIDANEGDFIGYMRYEENQLPELITKK